MSRVTPMIQQYLEIKESYRCQQCGLESDKITWKCPGCHNWDTVQPRKIASE